MKKKVLIGLFWKFSESISSQLISFVISIVLARLLAPADYGIVALVNVFIVIANVFVTSGFGTALIQKKDADETDFSTIFYLSELTSIIIYIIIFLCAPLIASFYHNSKLISVLRLFALNLPLSAFNGIQQAFISKHLMFRKVFISTTIASILSGIVGIIMAYLHFGVWALVYQSLANTIFISITLAFQIKWHPQLKFSWKAGKPLISFGWKILATDLLGNIFNQLNSMILGKVYTASDLAYYNKGQSFPDLIRSNIDGTISTVLFPALSKYNDDFYKIKLIMRRSIKTSMFVITPLLFGLAATASSVIELLLTKKWLPTVPYLQILCFSDVFDTVSNTSLQSFKAVGRSDINLKLEFAKKPIYLIMLLLSIRISVIAVAYSMVIYNIYSVIINTIPNRKLFKYSFKEQVYDILPAVLNSTVMFIIVQLIAKLDLPLYMILLIQIFVGAIVYLVIALIFKMDALKFVFDLVIKHFD